MPFRRSEKPCQTFPSGRVRHQIRDPLVAAVQPETLYEKELVPRCNKRTVVGHLDQISRRSACGDPSQRGLRDTDVAIEELGLRMAPRRGKWCEVRRTHEPNDLGGGDAPVDPASCPAPPRPKS